MLRDDAAMADAPIVLKAHQANTALAGERRSLREGELAFRLDQVRFVDSAHGFGVAATRRFAPEFRGAERLHVNVADAGLGEAGRKHMLGKAGAARIGDFAHIHQRFHFRGFQRCHEIWNTDAFIADGPDAAHCR